jgi:hypothetical protein
VYAWQQGGVGGRPLLVGRRGATGPALTHPGPGLPLHLPAQTEDEIKAIVRAAQAPARRLGPEPDGLAGS